MLYRGLFNCLTSFRQAPQSPASTTITWSDRAKATGNRVYAVLAGGVRVHS